MFLGGYGKFYACKWRIIEFDVNLCVFVIEMYEEPINPLILLLQLLVHTKKEILHFCFIVIKINILLVY